MCMALREEVRSGTHRPPLRASQDRCSPSTRIVESAGGRFDGEDDNLGVVSTSDVA